MLAYAKELETLSSSSKSTESPSHRKIEGTYISTYQRLAGLLSLISEELKDVIFYYTLPELASTLHATTPTLGDIQAALVNAGYRVSSFHHEANAIKTDAPPKIVWDVMRCYCQLKPPLGSKHRKNIDGQQDAGELILATQPTLEANFKAPSHLLEKWKVRQEGFSRFPFNPEADWGPKGRAGKSEAQKGKAKERSREKEERRKAHQAAAIERERKKRKAGNSPEMTL